MKENYQLNKALDFKKWGSWQICKVSWFCLLCISKSSSVTVATCKVKLILYAPKTRVLQNICPTTGDKYQWNWIGSFSKIRGTGDDLMYLFQTAVEGFSFWCVCIGGGAGKLYCFRVTILATLKKKEEKALFRAFIPFPEINKYSK